MARSFYSKMQMGSSWYHFTFCSNHRDKGRWPRKKQREEGPFSPYVTFSSLPRPNSAESSSGERASDSRAGMPCKAESIHGLSPIKCLGIDVVEATSDCVCLRTFKEPSQEGGARRLSQKLPVGVPLVQRTEAISTATSHPAEDSEETRLVQQDPQFFQLKNREIGQGSKCFHLFS